MLCTRRLASTSRACHLLDPLPRSLILQQRYYTPRRAISSMSSSTTSTTPLLITPQRLASLMSQAKSTGGQSIRILDATWFMPNVKRDPLQEYLKGPRIPTSMFWDVESIASLKEEVDESGKSLNPMGLAHMMPTEEKFARAACKCGLCFCLSPVT
jgi:3-mercaptopyruvate sulfurtransferase SseA